MGLISNGTTIFDNGAMASGFGGNMVLVSSATASASATIEFYFRGLQGISILLCEYTPINRWKLISI
jgi:hypothetical protein